MRDIAIDAAVKTVAKRISYPGYRRALYTWLWYGVPKTFVTMIGKEFRRQWHLH